MKKNYVSPTLYAKTFGVDIVCASTQVLGDDNCIYWPTGENDFSEGN